MVVHEDSEIPMVMAVAREPVFEAKSRFVVVKNHVRELPSDDKDLIKNTSGDNPSRDTVSELKKKRKKSTKKFEEERNSPTISAPESGVRELNKVSEISVNDLQELKTVYKKCKAIIQKIEIKYGHLLHINEEAGPSRHKRTASSEIEEECHCTLNKKIVFDDDGKQSTIDPVVENHICPKKLKKTHSDPIENKNIQIEYYENEITLPEDLQELSNILQNPDLETTYRNKVIDKVRSIKQELTNEIKFNKHSLIEKLKANPDELLDFKGTNLSSLPGYL